MIRRSAKNPRPIGLKRHRSSSARRSVLSAALCRGCQCVGARGAETDSHWNTGIEFTPLLVICWVFPDFHTASGPVTLASKEEIRLYGASKVEIFKLVSLGGRFRVQGEISRLHL